MLIGTEKHKKQNNRGFTIIEMVMVIVIIGILSAITIVGYNGIQAKARDNSVLSDLENMDTAQTKYGLDHGVSGFEYYSGTGPSAELNFTPSEGNVIDVVINSDDYCIRGYNPNGSKKSINDAYTKASSPNACNILGASIAAGGIETITINTDPIQIWMKQNINEGTMIESPNDLLNNSEIEKYCYDNNEENCTQYGALYTWEEAMQGSITEAAQGVCPIGYHIPTDQEWKTLEIFLTMPSGEADMFAWLRGDHEDIATMLRTGGSTGLDLKLGGGYSTSFDYLSLNGGYWTSSESGPTIWDGPIYRFFDANWSPHVGRWDSDIGFGNYMSVRCMKSI